jgi:hypothetical protein
VTTLPSRTDPDGHTVVGVTLGHPDTRAADHWLSTLDPRPLAASTHMVRTPRPHVALTLTYEGDVPDLGPEAAACEEALTDPSGRATIFEGSETLTGDLPIATVLSSTAIDRLAILGGGSISPDATLRTGDFVRPQWQNNDLVLTVMPGPAGTLVPFETRNPTPCCSNHP